MGLKTKQKADSFLQYTKEWIVATEEGRLGKSIYRAKAITA